MSPKSPEDDQKFKELVTYLLILNKGRGQGQLKEARSLVRRLGTRRFGEPSLQVARKLDFMDNLEHLEDIADRLLDPHLASWDDLLHDA
jgi:hypothetical protein